MKERVEGAPVNMHVYLCEVTVGCVYHGEVSEECSKVGYHALYCTGSLEGKLVEQKTLLDHYKLNNAHQITWRAESAKQFAEWVQNFLLELVKS